MAKHVDPGNAVPLLGRKLRKLAVQLATDLLLPKPLNHTASIQLESLYEVVPRSCSSFSTVAAKSTCGTNADNHDVYLQ